MTFNQDSFNKFISLILDQFNYGGKKYALNGDNQRESTDELFDRHGKNWLFGTVDKYTFRFKTVSREKDLLKIATYMYIIWLKRGFFVVPSGVNDPPIDTNLKVKGENFQKFIDEVKESNIHFKDWYIHSHTTIETFLESISESLKNFSTLVWKRIGSHDLISIFLKTYYIWNEKFSDKAGQDTDTWNEGKEK